MSEKQVRDYDKFMLRFPDGMRDAIAERAKRNGRSMNSEIIKILENTLYCGDGDLHDMNENEMLEIIKTQEALLKEALQRLEVITQGLRANKKPT
ncbi:Arc family DNA-binding protein [Salmonella enterica]|uniref:Arc family DNA-binding protein n=1 Tax=Salmonella enterica TaxID=28901 RepID=UPI000D57F454|nr:Arc family DNA-binding protein [Salmonella enterica]ECS6724079.1 Arc family DNA-binding protein [Salmonella enterica subsp. enterica serovar Oranienburg]EDR9143420.1 Arc family DNA-binding protein [Salmonella enterica subsp. enterica serovar Braenderup]EAZ0407581.1 Arc family DNA-binding protein [Salmonella enterica]EBE6132442.1 Arc family DNA-binding protein [Salmonella enterica]EBI7827473.1 Arc family DNA-binding protein [Salmonella enterica]